MNDLKISYRDIRRHPLADKVSYPGTADKDRYARDVRRYIRIMLDSVENVDTPNERLWDSILSSLLFSVNRNDSIEENRLRLINGLDIMNMFTGGEVVWRSAPCTCPEDGYSPLCTSPLH